MSIEKRCANCDSKYIAGDKYCRFCGAPLKVRIYTNSDVDFSPIYGPPPVSHTHTCATCGYSWQTSYMLSDNENWCPKCGGKAPVTNTEDSI